MREFLVAAIAVVSTAAVLPAHATLLNDYQWVNTYLAAGDSLTVTHDLRPEIPGSYQATAGVLALSFYDNDPLSSSEYAEIELPGFSVTDEIGGLWFFSDIQLLGLTVSALLNLNVDGLLDVTVTALSGDFVWQSSNLTVNAQPITRVSEPQTLGLFGVALLVFAFGLYGRRRRR